jgi:ATP-dependent helicase/nuclease subunit B
MLQLLLAASDGGTAWRHRLARGETRAGWECVGPLGLARRLGRLYGLRGEPAPHAERVSSYAARLARLDDGARSFSASRARDPWGVAGFLLDLRDRLRLAEWDGAGLDGSGRLEDVAALEALAAPGLLPVPPGLADLLASLLAELRSAPLPEPLAIQLCEPREAFDPVVRRVLEVLAAAGARVEDAAPEAPSAPASTDLGRLQRGLLSAVAGEPAPALGDDGSVLLLEADTPLEAGELLAALARSGPLDRATLVEGRDLGALEAALARQGLPALGSRDPSRWRPALQVLPLRLALAFAPRDPFRAAELLMLPVAPLPRAVRRRLLDALAEQPGVGGPAWRRAVEASAGEAGVRERVEEWFGGEAFARDRGLPPAEAIRICELVARWADGRARAGDGDEPDLGLPGAARVARTLARMLAEQPPGALLSPVLLEQLHDVAAGEGLDGAGGPGEAGRPAIAREPGDVQAGAATVLWWGFLGGEPGPPPEPWTVPERAALERRGLRLPGPGARRAIEALGWRRAVLAASERLVLVRWRLEGTTPTVAHPLADEIAARFQRSLGPCTLASERALAGEAPGGLAPPVSDRAPAPEVAPRASFRVPPETLATDRFSPSSLEKLLGCPVAWVLEYAAGLRRRGMARIPSGSRLLGTFAHAILEELLLGPDRLDLARATPAEASEAALRMFGERVEREAAPLVVRGAEVERHRARQVVSDAARSLVELLQAGGWTPVAAEAELAGRFEGADLAGKADLLLERAGGKGVLDLKLARSSRYFVEKLEQGQALQVALYAELAREGGRLPATGYFLLNRGEVLTADRGGFPGARELAGPSMQETLAAAGEAIRFWRSVLARGLVSSRHEDQRVGALLEAGEAAGRAAPSSGPGDIDPPCRFCDFDALCGVTLREVVR